MINDFLSQRNLRVKDTKALAAKIHKALKPMKIEAEIIYQNYNPYYNNPWQKYLLGGTIATNNTELLGQAIGGSAGSVYVSDSTRPTLEATLTGDSALGASATTTNVFQLTGTNK
jgi:hypothetical protein